jgi:hypothetical protein
MTAKVEFEVTSDQAGQIPAIGTFEPGQTIKVDRVMLQVFEATYGCKLAEGNFPPYVHVTTRLTRDKPAEPEVKVEVDETVEENAADTEDEEEVQV